MRSSCSRRDFIKKAIIAGPVVSGASTFASPSDGVAQPAHAVTQQAARIGALDHVAIPIQRVEQMVEFYRALGFRVSEVGQGISVHFGHQKINFHVPARWQNENFTLRAAEAIPPCGDFCWVWEGTSEALRSVLQAAEAEIVAEGERRGGRDGGSAIGESVYVRDPDGNLLEFISYA
ncbi:MAG: hypothetical protein IIB36_03700 [Gemmatimonadetes bacterium]|nr:hypothetical protein [Gemmatimonadota bacterium]